MAQGIELISSPLIVAKGSTALQDLSAAIDISAFDRLDLQLVVVSGNASLVSATILTSMELSPDIGAWISAGVITGAGVWGGVASIPVPGSVLLRYARYLVMNGDPSHDATVLLHGMARRLSL